MQKKEQVNSGDLVDAFDNLRLSNSQEANPPTNWPNNLKYVTNNLWDNISSEFKTKYEDSTEISPCVEVIEEEEEDKKKLYKVVSKTSLADGVWLGEYTGIVKNVSSISDRERLAFSVRLCEHNKESFVIDASEYGNELRYLRKARTKEEANCKLYRLMVDGFARVFLQISKDITEEGTELLVENDYVSNLAIPNPYSKSSKSFKQEEISHNYEKEEFYNEYYYIHNLIINQKYLKEEELEFLTTRRDLSDMIEIHKITDKKHPCCGQLGVFAKTDIENGEYIGEYAGRVLDKVEEPFSHYLVDFSNPHSEGCEKVWVDALVEGNETRYINDAMNTGLTINVTFRKMFLDGVMRVYVQVTSPIKEGNEVLVDYGEGYWSNMPGFNEDKNS